MSPIILQERLFWCISEHIEQYHYAPSIQEMKRALQITSSSAVQDALRQLKVAGFIDWMPSRSRTWRPTTSQLPWYGRVEAGFRVEHPSDEPQQTVMVPRQDYRPGDFVLQVCGDSMVGAGIQPGDALVMRPHEDLTTLKPRTIGAVWLRGEGLTLKHVTVGAAHGSIKLEANNPGYGESVYIAEPTDVELVGILVHAAPRYFIQHGTD